MPPAEAVRDNEIIFGAALGAVRGGIMNMRSCEIAAYFQDFEQQKLELIIENDTDQASKLCDRYLLLDEVVSAFDAACRAALTAIKDTVGIHK